MLEKFRNVRFTLYIDENLLKVLKITAIEKGISTSNLIEQLIQDALYIPNEINENGNRF